MNFKRNILGVAVLSGTVFLAGQAVADASLDAPEAVTGIPATAVTVAGVTNHLVAGRVSYTAANTAVGNLDTAVRNAAKDVSDLVAINKNITTAEGLISQAQALSAGQLLNGFTKAEIVLAQRQLLGVNATTGVYTPGTNGLYNDRDVEALEGVATAKAEAAAQAAVNTLATGGISNSLILGLQAAEEETDQDEANGTFTTGATAGTLGKIAFDADAAVGTVRTTALPAQSDATLLRRAADDAAAAVTTQAALVTAANANTEDNSAASYQAATQAGSDATSAYALTAANTVDGKVVDVRDQTKQIVWTFGAANNAAANTGTLTELAAAITANGMDYTAAVDVNDANTLVLTATDTKLGAVVQAAKVGVGADAASAATDANTPTINPTDTPAVDYIAQNLTTFEVHLAELRLAATAANNELSAAIADAANKKAVYEAGLVLEASYAETEKLQLTEAGAAMATISGVLNEDLAVANAATAALEKTAQDLEAITAEDEDDLEAAQATLTDAKADVASAETAKEEARLAFVADSSSENSTAYSTALATYNTAVAAESTAQLAVTSASNILYGVGSTAATAIGDQDGTNKDSALARKDVVDSQKTATGKENFLDMQVQLADTDNPAGALQSGLMVSGNDSGALVVTAVNSNYQATKTNAAGIAANVATLAVHEGLVTTNTANIATNTTNIATNTADIATNTADIATNTAKIVDLDNGLTEGVANLQRVEMQMNENVDMLKSGIASALAIAGMPTAPGEGMGFSVGTGYFDGESAVAMGLTFVDGSRSYKLSLGHSGGETSASAGAAFKF